MTHKKRSFSAKIGLHSARVKTKVQEEDFQELQKKYQQVCQENIGLLAENKGLKKINGILVEENELLRNEGLDREAREKVQEQENRTLRGRNINLFDEMHESKLQTRKSLLELEKSKKEAAKLQTLLDHARKESRIEERVKAFREIQENLLDLIMQARGGVRRLARLPDDEVEPFSPHTGLTCKSSSGGNERSSRAQGIGPSAYVANQNWGVRSRPGRWRTRGGELLARIFAAKRGRAVAKRLDALSTVIQEDIDLQKSREDNFGSWEEQLETQEQLRRRAVWTEQRLMEEHSKTFMLEERLRQANEILQVPQTPPRDRSCSGKLEVVPSTLSKRVSKKVHSW